ncbi:MAG TPA: ABC-2 family transporter protein [Kofleriaceae bacterium]|nr:ABC-2 family transporter protein [Kofleriaceae bacterium]
MTRTLRAIPTLLRVGVAETVAYRAEFLIWILTTTLPLVMLALWTSVASERAFRSYSSEDFVAYYLAVLIVRNLTGTWVAWQVSEDVRMGSMSMRLLRPLHPFVAYAASHLAAVPFRSLVVLPIAGVLLLSSGASSLTREPVQLALIVPSLALAWLITFSLLFALGALAFFITKAMALLNLYFMTFSLFSGYLLPQDLLPGWIARAAAVLPFRYMLGVPVELMTRAHAPGEVRNLMLGQLAWAAVSLVVALRVWRLGVRRYEAVGG